MGKYEVGSRTVDAVVTIKNPSDQDVLFGFDGPTMSGLGLVADSAAYYSDFEFGGDFGYGYNATTAVTSAVDGDCIRPRDVFVLQPGQEFGYSVFVEVKPFDRVGRIVLVLNLRVRLLRPDLECANDLGYIEKKVELNIDIIKAGV